MSSQVISFSQLSFDFTQVKSHLDAFIEQIRRPSSHKKEAKVNSDDIIEHKAELLIAELESYLNLAKQDESICLTVAQSDFLTKLDVEIKIREFEQATLAEGGQEVLYAKRFQPELLLLRIYRLLYDIHVQLTINSFKLDDHDQAWNSRIVEPGNAA